MSKHKKNLVFTSAGDNTLFHKLWLDKNRNYDVWVVYYGDNEKVYQKYKNKVDYIEKRKGSKFQNFSHIYKSKELSQYERFFILDDDIIISTKDINKMFMLSEKLKLKICGPSFDTKSKISWEITKHNTEYYFKYTNWVEVNTPLFTKESLKKLMDVYDDKLIGWGIDYLYIWANGLEEKSSYAIIHNISCTNPTDSDKGGKRELQKIDNCSDRAKIWEEFRIKNNIPIFEPNNWGGVKNEELIEAKRKLRKPHNDILFKGVYENNLVVPVSENEILKDKLKFKRNSVGVGMVTYNASHRIEKSAFTVPKWIENFVIVNDGTPYNEDIYPPQAHIIQHKTNQSVGAAKTTALNYLLSKNCEHIFLMEDDILIKNENVFEEYIRHSLISGIKHLNFALHGPANKKDAQIFTNLEERIDVEGEPNPKMLIPYKNKEDVSDITIALYPNCVGAFSYYYRSVLEDIGGFDPKFKNAWEHVEHTYQTIKKGYHPSFWYFADIHKSWEYLTDIPNSIEESTIARTQTWKDNFMKSTLWYKKKHGFTPIKTPRKSKKEIQKELQILLKNR